VEIFDNVTLHPGRSPVNLFRVSKLETNENASPPPITGVADVEGLRQRNEALGENLTFVKADLTSARASEAMSQVTIDELRDEVEQLRRIKGDLSKFLNQEKADRVDLELFYEGLAKNLKNDVKYRNEKIEELERKISGLQNGIKVRDGKIGVLQEDVGNLQADVVRLQDANLALAQSVGSLQDANLTLTQSV
jgi:chromosome segregation ATPase